MKLFAAREEDAHHGWVWLQNAAFPARCIVKITNLENRKSIYCEALQIESNFLTQYNQQPRFPIKDPASSLVIGAWFRARLGGLKPQSEISLKIMPCRSWWAPFKSCTHHPQVVVRLSAWLGGIGLILGIIGLVLGAVSLWPCHG
jgi:hypothetical protein